MQAVDDVPRAVLLDLEPHGRAAVHLAKLGLDRAKQVVGLLLVDVEITVAGDAEEVCAP